MWWIQLFNFSYLNSILKLVTTKKKIKDLSKKYKIFTILDMIIHCIVLVIHTEYGLINYCIINKI